MNTAITLPDEGRGAAKPPQRRNKLNTETYLKEAIPTNFENDPGFSVHEGTWFPDRLPVLGKNMMEGELLRRSEMRGKELYG